MERARHQLPEVVRTYMRVLRVTQEELGEALGLTQRQVSRRLIMPGSISAEEVAALADFFGVEITSLYKPVPAALADLLNTPSRFPQPPETVKGGDTPPDQQLAPSRCTARVLALGAAA